MELVLLERALSVLEVLSPQWTVLDDLLTLYTPDVLITERLVREIHPIPIWFAREIGIYDFFFFFLSDVTVLGICVKTKSYATPLYISVAIVTLYVLMAIVRVGPLVT